MGQTIHKNNERKKCIGQSFWFISGLVIFFVIGYFLDWRLFSGIGLSLTYTILYYHRVICPEKHRKEKIKVFQTTRKKRGAA